jgi:hypothetical protein
MTDAPLCSKCRWSIGDDEGEQSRRCYNFDVVVFDHEKRPDKSRSIQYAWLVREQGICGPAGRLFEPRKPWLKRIFGGR